MHSIDKSSLGVKPTCINYCLLKYYTVVFQARKIFEAVELETINLEVTVVILRESFDEKEKLFAYLDIRVQNLSSK